MDAVIIQEDVRRALGANVSKLRRAKGLTQVQLAEKLGISEVMLNRIERGKSLPGTILLYGLADELGVKADDLRQLPIDKS